MLRILLSLCSMLAACAPASQKAAMTDSSPLSGTTATSPSPGPLADSPAEARGRRILSTAFVRVGPDRHITVELDSGRVLVLRDPIMRPKDYCGVLVADGSTPAKYCGGYAEVAAARPGGAPAADQAVSAASAPASAPTKGK